MTEASTRSGFGLSRGFTQTLHTYEHDLVVGVEVWNSVDAVQVPSVPTTLRVLEKGLCGVSVGTLQRLTNSQKIAAVRFTVVLTPL